ncbi:MAG: energy-coupling factor ABC transporter permease [Gammaproteobacteria bacterium]|nr:energy-coupling factor ABC transporter permease [Gammaproteobacteria bacterium]
MNETYWLVGLHIPANLLPVSLMWAGNVLMLALILYAFKKFSFTELLNNNPNQNVFFGAMVALLLIWKIKAGISPGLGFHHLGATLFTLMFGWPLALLGLSTVMLASVLLQQNEVLSLGVNGLLSVAIPVFVSYGILRLSQKRLPDNFFIYIFVAAYFGAGIAVAASRLTAIALLSLVGAYPDSQLITESLVYVPLFMFPEAFVTGMLISTLVIYKPEWVISFDDKRYITGK